MAIEYYDDGSIALEAGSATVTGTDTAATLFGFAGGVLVAQGLGTAIPILSVQGDTAWTLLWPSPVTLSTSNYAVYLVPSDQATIIRLNELQARQLARSILVGLKPDARGSLGGRGAFDAEAEGFIYGINDDPPFYKFYEKGSDTSGDWEGPFQWYGPGGEDGINASLATLLAAAEPQTGADAATLAIDLELGDKLFHQFTIADDRTLGFPTNIPNAGITFYVKVTQDGTGGRTLAFGSGYEGARGVMPTISEVADTETLLCVVMLAEDRGVIFTVGQEFAAS